METRLPENHRGNRVLRCGPCAIGKSRLAARRPLPVCGQFGVLCENIAGREPGTRATVQDQPSPDGRNIYDQVPTSFEWIRDRPRRFAW